MPDVTLGSIIRHPKHGEGIVIFEEASSTPDWRILLIAFAEHTEEVIPARLNEHGFRVTGGRVDLPASRRRLPGHDAVTGRAVSVQEAREALENERVL